MNENINAYVEKRISEINKILSDKSHEEIIKRIMTAIVIAAFVIVGLQMDRFATGIGYIVYIASAIVNGIRSTVEYNEIKKNYGKEKKHLLELKDNEEQLDKKAVHSKLTKLDVKESLTRFGEMKLGSIKNLTSILRAVTFFGSIATVVNPQLIWLGVTSLGLFTISSAVEMQYSAKIENAKREKSNLEHDIHIDKMLKEDNKGTPAVITELKAKEDTIVSDKDLEKVEKMVEDLANQKEEEKPKEYIKK